MSKKEVGGRVLQVRTAAKLNQREFASRLGTGSGRISSIESGENMPGGDFLLRLQQEFGVDLNWLLTGESGGNVPPVVPVLTNDQRALLDNYDACGPEGRDAVRRTASALAQQGVAAGSKRGKKSA